MSRPEPPQEPELQPHTIEAIAAAVVAKQPAPKRDYFTIVLPLIGVILGAVVGGFATYLANSNLEPEKQVLQLQLSAYSDYVKAQAALLWAKPEQEVEANQKIRDAAMRMVIYSPATLIEKMADFIKEKQQRPCTATRKDIAVYQEMRREALKAKAGELSNATVAMAIFGCEYQDKT